MKWWKRVTDAVRGGDKGFSIQLVTDRGNGYYAWNGGMYKSDIIRAAIRPKVKAVGKLLAVHVREKVGEKLLVNPDAYMRMLLEEPNPYSTGQMMQEKMATQLALNNNAFALIYRDPNDFPVQLYPIPAVSVDAIRENGELLLRFMFGTGKQMTIPYGDVIHIRDDYNENDIFGEPKADALKPLMEIVNASDQSIVNAVKNSSIIKWILKFKTSLKKEDRDAQIKDFTESFLSVNSEGGAAYSDPRYDLEQVKPDTYVPNTAQQKEAVQRIYSFFGTNDKIVQAKYSEDEWIAYYESEIEPIAVQLSGEFTRKLFSRRERGFGNRVVFESSNLAHASMKTKLALVSLVDRGAMTPNEWRRVMNLGPIEGGEKAIRRLDTVEVGVGKGGDENK